MKILYIITQGECGGGQRNVLDLAVGARNAGHSVTVATGRQETMADRWLFDELKAAGFSGRTSHSDRTGRPELVVVPALRRSINPFHDIAACFAMRRLIRRLRPDIVHLHSSKAGSVGAVAARAAFVGAKVVYTVHGFVIAEPLSRPARLFYLVSEFTASFFRDLVITVSARDQAIGYYHNLIHSRSVVVYNGIDQQKKAEILSFSNARGAILEHLPKEVAAAAGSKRVIGVIANLYPTKGLTHLIDAAVLLRQYGRPIGSDAASGIGATTQSDFLFVVIGDGALRAELERKIQENNLADSFFLIGSLADAYRYLPAFDLFVLPSVKEGFPYVLLEALLAGRHFIASAVGGIPELVERLPAGVGRLVPAGDPMALAKTIDAFFRTPQPTSVRLPDEFSVEHMRAATFAEYARLKKV